MSRSLTGWHDGILGDFITLKRGYDLPKQDRRPGSIPIISSSGVSDYHVVAMARGPGVVTGRYGTLGQVFYVDEDYWPLNTALYVSDFKGNDPRFVNYFLKTLDFFAYSDKAAVPGLNRNHLHEAQVHFPKSIGEQREIASILGALDDKIELNRKISATLEAMARAIFTSWFVDFDPVRAKADGRSAGLATEIAALFPDAFEDSVDGDTPVGWLNVPLSDVMTFEGGSQPPASEFISEPLDGYVRLVQIRDFYTDAHQTFVPDTSRLRKFDVNDLMIARYGSSGSSSTDSLGRICRGLSGAYNVALVKVIPKRHIREFLGYFLQSDTFQSAIKGMGTRSVQSGFRKEDLSTIYVTIAPENVHEQFERIATTVWQRKQSLEIESRILSQLRDTLLPKLISGQLRVSEAERILEKSP